MTRYQFFTVRPPFMKTVYSINSIELVSSSSPNLVKSALTLLQSYLMRHKIFKIPQHAVADTSAQVLFHAAISLRSERQIAIGIETQPLNVSAAIFKIAVVISESTH